MTSLIKRFIREEEGMEILEWAIVAVLFAAAAAGIFTTLSGTVTNQLQNVNDTVFN